MSQAPDFSGVTDTPERLKFDETALASYMAKIVKGFKKIIPELFC